ncbi:hypothetical protein GIB67_023237, partial [Kingdonia uniflora]
QYLLTDTATDYSETEGNINILTSLKNDYPRPIPIWIFSVGRTFRVQQRFNHLDLVLSVLGIFRALWMPSKLKREQRYIRGSITPGTVLIMLAWEVKGKGVMFVKQLSSDNLLWGILDIDGLMDVLWGILDIEQPGTQAINKIVVPSESGDVMWNIPGYLSDDLTMNNIKGKCDESEDDSSVDAKSDVDMKEYVQHQDDHNIESGCRENSKLDMNGKHFEGKAIHFSGRTSSAMHVPDLRSLNGDRLHWTILANEDQTASVISDPIQADHLQT